MADRDQGWNFGGRDRGRDREAERDRGRREDRWSGGERRAFDEDDTRHGPGTRGRRFEGGEPWRGEARYGARYDQDRTGYGGQEYGLEGGRGHREGQERWRQDRDERETWRPDRGEPYGDLELNPRNRGVEAFGPPHDYAYHPRAGHEFEPDYLRWRDEQMRGHDRDYQEWRRHQQGQYDEDYRRFRSERRDHFGRTFQDWRSQRSAADGSYEVRGAGGGDASPEFGKAPPQVQAAAGGWDGRGAPEDKVAKDQARAEDERAKAEDRRADEAAKDDKTH